jgi:hypothetical protein
MVSRESNGIDEPVVVRATAKEDFHELAHHPRSKIHCSIGLQPREKRLAAAT